MNHFIGMSDHSLFVHTRRFAKLERHADYTPGPATTRAKPDGHKHHADEYVSKERVKDLQTSTF